MLSMSHFHHQIWGFGEFWRYIHCSGSYVPFYREVFGHVGFFTELLYAVIFVWKWTSLVSIFLCWVLMAYDKPPQHFGSCSFIWLVCCSTSLQCIFSHKLVQILRAHGNIVVERKKHVQIVCISVAHFMGVYHMQWLCRSYSWTDDHIKGANCSRYTFSAKKWE